MRQYALALCAAVHIKLRFHTYWKFADFVRGKSGIWELMRLKYLERWCCYIGRDAKFAGIPTMPHGFDGIHISSGSVIGKNAVIFQNVTIGSNTLKDSLRQGSPKIGDNVFIGAGASIIGNVSIGNNCRIGANCVVVKDMPPNTLAVIGDVRYIHKKESMDNEFVSWEEFALHRNVVGEA